MDRLRGKVALVTGGARGIGLAVAELFAAEGATTIAGDITPPDAPGFRGKVEHARLDVSSPEDWARVVDGIVARHGGIDILVNNAGIVLSYEPVHATDVESWSKVIAVNQTGTFLGMRAVLPAMRKAGRGSIVNISSIWGNVGAAGAAAYHAAKGAVRNMTKNAAITYAGENVRVNSIHPGIIDTPLIRAQDQAITDAVVGITPMKRLGRPAEVAYGILFLASDEASFVTGAELAIDGGYLAQ
jgi:NAD(P)-dependent dehydrogenase (short-subunit alcohol dehydrogenase family)